MNVLHANSSPNSEDHYSVYFDNKLESLRKLIQQKKYAKIFVIVDENTKQYCLEHLSNSVTDFSIIEIEAGEKNKTLQTCEKVWHTLLEKNADRNDLVINLGGGVIGDLGGFCAATFKRGLDFIQVPTTLLSQVDASIGGKLGIDFHGFKNNIGLFKNPKAVIINTDFLNTLPYKEVRSGYAELLKHALIANKAHWEGFQIIHDLTVGAVVLAIESSVTIKNEVVSIDPLESGWRKILNFGHTIGHAVETLHLDTANHLLHGEAIAIGMICECYLSNKLTGLESDKLDEIVKYLTQIYGVKRGILNDEEKLLENMRQDKKNIGNAINFTLLKAIGEPVINQEVSEEMICKSLMYYNSL